MLGLTFVCVVSGKVISFFDVRVCHPNADSYKDLELRQAKFTRYTKTRRSASMQLYRVLEIEQGAFTPLVFITTGSLGKECVRYHSRSAEL